MVRVGMRENDIADFFRINPQGFNLVDDQLKRGPGPSLDDHAHLSHGTVGGEGRRSQLKQMGVMTRGLCNLSVMRFHPFNYESRCQKKGHGFSHGPSLTV